MKREAEQLGTTVAALSRELRAEASPVDVVMMAYGSQERLAAVTETPKQLFDIGDGETILGRTLRWIALLAPCKVGICAPAPIAEHAIAMFQAAMLRCGETPAARTLIDNMYAASFKPRPDHAQLFLLADVVWAPGDLARVLGDRHPAPIFYGRHRNPYTQKEYPELFALRATPTDLEPHRDCGTLWDLHRRIGVHAPIREMHGYTDDVDTPEDFAERLPLLRSFVEETR